MHTAHDSATLSSAYQARYEIGALVDGVYVSRPIGSMTIARLGGLISQIEALERTHPEVFNRFCDYRQIDRVQVDPDGIQDLCERRKRSIDPTRTVRAAFVVANSLGFGLLRIYQAYLADTALDVEIFTNADEAARFVGLDLTVLASRG